MLVQRFGPQGRRFTNFRYYYYYYTQEKVSAKRCCFCVFRDRLRTSCNVISHTFCAAVTYHFCKQNLKQADDKNGPSDDVAEADMSNV